MTLGDTLIGRAEAGDSVSESRGEVQRCLWVMGRAAPCSGGHASVPRGRVCLALFSAELVLRLRSAAGAGGEGLWSDALCLSSWGSVVPAP